MSRLHLTQEEVDLLDFSQIEDLRAEVNQELVNLNNLEWMLYKRRRELELAENPELGIDYYTSSAEIQPTKQTSNSLTDMLQELQSQGVDIKSLLTSIH